MNFLGVGWGWDGVAATGHRVKADGDGVGTEKFLWGWGGVGLMSTIRCHSVV